MTRTVSSTALRRAGIVAALAGAVALGGCAKRNVEIQAEIPDAYQERHPIVIGDVPVHMDVFLAGNGGLDRRQADDVRAFVSQYRSKGKGALVAILPGGAPQGSVHHTLGEIRRLASESGVNGGYLQVQNGGASHPTAASIRLQFSQLGAKVSSRCGQWPFDPAGGTTTQSWTNRPLYNLGCSYQTHLAAQVANPVDMIRARPETEIDIQKRLADIDAVRKGNDPTTKWPADQTKVNSALQ